MRSKGATRVLALDLHPRRFGYVVVEGADRLLDWGVRSCRRNGKPIDVLLQKRLRALLELWSPSVIVLNDPVGRARRSNPKSGRSLKQIAIEAKHRRILMRMLKPVCTEIQGERLTRYENARRVAEHFPALKGKLPPKRRAWESEHYSMSIFTAAALAISPGSQ
jgi:hypothetical protein